MRVSTVAFWRRKKSEAELSLERLQSGVAAAGDNVGLLLDGVPREAVGRGDTVSG